MNTWYSTLDRPPLTPPNWVFSPVWTVLYVVIAVSIVTYYRTPGRNRMALTTMVLTIHLIANFAWTYLFFGLRSPGAALIDIIVLDTTLLALIVWFWKARPLSGALLIPYMAWVLFATYLNCGFYLLNR
jgi:benzodiazapine receptor